MTDPILSEAERITDRARVVEAYAEANKVPADDTRLHVYETPCGSFVTIGPVSQPGWARLAQWAMEKATAQKG